ncbi:hypothetical protein F5Y09DRAFT_311234 [Xylaria sp. FL1042]|nr:hypothetical protein F5Y09DRAFT_311234 [Xylaria sp. FL1042]
MLATLRLTVAIFPGIWGADRQLVLSIACMSALGHCTSWHAQVLIQPSRRLSRSSCMCLRKRAMHLRLIGPLVRWFSGSLVSDANIMINMPWKLRVGILALLRPLITCR